MIHKISKPESFLQKKNNAICYHKVYESVTMGESLSTHIDSNEYPADIQTKGLRFKQWKEKIFS